jgi:hypothetical protein
VYHLNVIDVAGFVFESPATSRRSAPRHHVPKSSGDGPGPEPTVSSRGGSALLPTRPPSMDHVSERDFCHFHMTLKAACDTWSDTDYGSSEKLIAHLSTQESLFELGESWVQLCAFFHDEVGYTPGRPFMLPEARWEYDGDRECEDEDANDAEMVQVPEELGGLKID